MNTLAETHLPDTHGTREAHGSQVNFWADVNQDGALDHVRAIAYETGDGIDFSVFVQRYGGGIEGQPALDTAQYYGSEINPDRAVLQFSGASLEAGDQTPGRFHLYFDGPQDGFRVTYTDKVALETPITTDEKNWPEPVTERDADPVQVPTF